MSTAAGPAVSPGTLLYRAVSMTGVGICITGAVGYSIPLAIAVGTGWYHEATMSYARSGSITLVVVGLLVAAFAGWARSQRSDPRRPLPEVRRAMNELRAVRRDVAELRRLVAAAGQPAQAAIAHLEEVTAELEGVTAEVAAKVGVAYTTGFVDGVSGQDPS